MALPDGMWPGPIDVAVREVLDCACDLLGERCPCAVHTTMGFPVAYRCCGDCKGEVGQLTAHAVRAFPTQNFPFERRDPIDGCNPPIPIAVEIKVVIQRCHPVIGKGGKPPSQEVLDMAAAQAHRDMFDLVKALSCCVPEKRGKTHFGGVAPTDIGQFVTTGTIGSSFGGCSSITGNVITKLLSTDFDHVEGS
jgi:hypothetical protein